MQRAKMEMIWKTDLRNFVFRELKMSLTFKNVLFFINMFSTTWVSLKCPLIFLYIIYMTTLSSSLIKEQSFAATKPRLFFPFKGILPEQCYVDFLFGSKIKGSCGEFFWCTQRRREETGRGRERKWVAPQSSITKYEGKHKIKMHKLQFELNRGFRKPIYF